MTSAFTRLIYDFRHTDVYLALTFIIIPYWQFSWLDYASVTILSRASNIRTIPVGSLTWFCTRGSIGVAIIVSFITGFWVNSKSTKLYALVLTAINIVAIIVALIIPMDATLLACQIASYMFAGGLDTAILAYVTRAVSVTRRTGFFLALFTWERVVCGSAVLALQLAAPRFELYQVYLVSLGVLCGCFLFMLAFPEQPIQFAVSSPHDVKQDSEDIPSFSETSCFPGLRKSPQLLISLALVVLAFFASTVFSIVFENRVQLRVRLLGTALRYGLLFGGIGVIAVYLLILIVVAIRVDERKLVVGHAIVLLAGYLLLFDYHSFNIIRYALGSFLVVLSQVVIYSVSTALFTKIIPQPYHGIWIGVMSSFRYALLLAGYAWLDPIPHFFDTNLYPLYVTCGLMAVVLLALIPVYRHLLPQLYSPWSGQGLALKPGLPRSVNVPDEKAVPLLAIHVSRTLTEPPLSRPVVPVGSYDDLD